METTPDLVNETDGYEVVLIPAGKATFGSAEVLRVDGHRGIVPVLTD
jgi:hypothetical protein